MSKKLVLLDEKDILDTLAAIRIAMSTTARVNAWCAHDKYENLYKLLQKKWKEADLHKTKGVN